MFGNYANLVCYLDYRLQVLHVLMVHLEYQMLSSHDGRPFEIEMSVFPVLFQA